MTNIAIETVDEADFHLLWPILEPIICAGETYAFPVNMTEDEARAAWFAPDARVYGARLDSAVVGTAYLKPNTGEDDAVANAGFATAPAARGHGVARALCVRVLNDARGLGFRAMQFNFVVSTNEDALHLWRSLGFAIVATLPGAFRHPIHGFVDAYVMSKTL